MNQKQWWEQYWFEIGYFGGIVVGIGFYITCFYYAAHSPGPSINVLLCCAGATSGWFVGILTSPSTDTEKKEFSTYGKAISAFLSGVVLAKADSIFEQSIQANHQAGVIDLLLLRALLFGTTFIVAATVMFAGRRRHPTS
jgi:hypothetical protein